MDLSRRRFFGVRAPRVAPFRPPWSVAEARFVDLCSRCGDCVRLCPTGLIQRGPDGFPVADFAAAACSFCGECANVCATGAIAREAVPEPWAFTVRIDDSCLARQRVECRVCGEVCDADAIRFRPAVGGVSLPDLDTAACTACGACLAPCPVGAMARVARAPALSEEVS